MGNNLFFFSEAELKYFSEDNAELETFNLSTLDHQLIFDYT